MDGSAEIVRKMRAYGSTTVKRCLFEREHHPVKSSILADEVGIL
jgi:hypothetical protein